MIPGKVYKPEDVLKVAWRRKWIILVPFVLVSLGTGVVVNLLPDRYRSETLILIVPQRVPEDYVRSTVTARIEDRLPTISQQILSRTRLERIIFDFNLYAEQRREEIMEDIVEGMRQDVKVDIVKGDAFRVSYVSEDPRTAQKVTERLATLFIDENLRDRESLAVGTDQFLDAQLEEARRRLLDHEKRLEEFRRRYAGELPSQLNTNLQRIGTVQMQVQSLVESINRDRDRRLILERDFSELNTPAALQESESAAAPITDPFDETKGTAAQRLAAARDALRQMQLRLKPEHPDLVRVTRLVRELEQSAEAEALERPLTPGADGEASLSQAESERRARIRDLRLDIETLDAQIKSKEAEEVRLRALMSQYQARTEATPARESELVELTRDYGTIQELYTTLLAKKESARMAVSLERRQGGEQFRVLDAARLPERPISPNRIRLNLLGALAGLALGLGIGALLEYRDTSLRSEDDVVSALSLPVLALIPIMQTRVERQRRRRHRLAASLTAVTVVIGAAAMVWSLVL